MEAITPDDFAILRSLLQNEIARNERNTTTYYCNLFQRALDIVSEHVTPDADPVTSAQIWKLLSIP